MATTRKVTIFNSQTSAKEIIETSAATWGELKKQIRETSIGDKTCVLSGSKHILGLDEAGLPEGVFTVFVYPRESKGGMAKKKVAKKAAKKSAKKPVKKAKKTVKKSAPKSSALSETEEAKVSDEQSLAAEAQAIGSSLHKAKFR